MHVKQTKGVVEQVQKKYLDVTRRKMKMDYLIRNKWRFSNNTQLCCTYTVWLWHVTRRKKNMVLKIFTFHKILLSVEIKTNRTGVTLTTRSRYAKCIQNSSLRTCMEAVSCGT